MRGDTFYYRPYTLQGMFVQETATAVTDDTKSPGSTHARTLSLQPRGLVATAIARHSTHTRHVSITRYTRSVHILTTRGTVGVHICVERRETGSSVTTVDQGVFGRANP